MHRVVEQKVVQYGDRSETRELATEGKHDGQPKSDNVFSIAQNRDRGVLTE